MNLIFEGAKAGISKLGQLVTGDDGGPPPVEQPELPPEPQPDLAAAPPEVPRQKTPDEIDAELGLPPAAGDLPDPPDMDVGFLDVFGGAYTAETIRTDAWHYRQGLVTDLAFEMLDHMPAEVWYQVSGRVGNAGDGSTFETAVVEEAAKLAAADPEIAAALAGYPLSVDAFNARIEQTRKTNLEAAEAFEDQPGWGVAAFLGSTARAMTDQTSVAMLPFGFQGGAVRRLAGGAALGAVGEALVLPREYQVAKELGLEDPDPWSRIALGAMFGAGFEGAVIGASKGIGWLRNREVSRHEGLSSAQPDDVSSVEFEAGVDLAEARMNGTAPIQDRLADGPPASVAPGTLGEIAAGGDGRNWAGVAEAGKGYTVLVGPDGKAVRREGTRAWRNNNPGNIEYGPFARSMGAIGTDGRFAVFPSYEMGRKAKAQLLWGSKGYRGKTIGQAIARYAPSFENDTGAYTRSITKALGVRADTPMASLTAAQREMMLSVMERVEGFRPGKENGVQVSGPWRNPDDPSQDLPSFSGGSSRGYTGEGQVTAGDGFRIDVDYQVVDAASLLRASGDLQPRDRSRMSSDAWIADTAARLDPAQLMPSPTADRGTPIVGPDNVIESGNGRFGAISRVYERHPDRAAAYRGAIEAAGFAIPEGVERPVLIARRKTDLSPEERSRFAIEAQDSGVAVMTPTEIARTQSRAMTSPVLAQLDPSAPLKAEGNAGFVRAAMQSLPRSARNAMFDPNGMLNNLGERQLREALFARAWPDPDILARFTETDAGELKSLMEALERAAPSWAALKADIEAGLVNPEMDISAFVLDAMRLIGAARDLSKREGLPIAKAVQDLVEDIDLIEGAISPLTAAMVRKFWKNGRAASADEVAGFLTRYSDDARKAGAAGGLFDAPGPRDVLRAIDGKTFGDLPEDLGQARGFAQKGDKAAPEVPAREDGFDTGAQSPEAEAVDAEIRADLDRAAAITPPVTPQRMVTDFEGARAAAEEFKGKPLANEATGITAQVGRNNLDKMLSSKAAKKSTDAAVHSLAVANVDHLFARAELGWSKPDAKSEPSIRGIRRYFAPMDLPNGRTTMVMMTVKETVHPKQTNPLYTVEAVDVADGPAALAWVQSVRDRDMVSPVRAEPPLANAGETDTISREGAPDGQPASAQWVNARDAEGAGKSIRSDADPDNMAARIDDFNTAVDEGADIAAARAELGDDFADFELELGDGTSVSVRDVLDDLDADRAADEALNTCMLNPTATFGKGDGA